MANNSDVHANLDRDKLINDTWWLYYCCCGGVGLGPVGDPLFGADVKELCIRSICSTTDISNDMGLCHGMGVMCCITEQCQIPPMTGSPKCTCFNKAIVPGQGSITYKTDLFDYKQIFDETFWLYYMFCFGCGVSKPGVGRPYLAVNEKFLIIKGTVALVGPIEDGVACSSVGTECCLWSQCQLPPAPNAPMFKFCGKAGKGGSGNRGNVELPVKPGQVEMA